MKALCKIILNILSVVILVFSVFPFAAIADTITLVADEWCPYNCVPESDNPGYVVEIAREIFEKSGHRVIYKILPWKRALYSAMKGINSGVIAATSFSMPKGIFHKEPLGFYLMHYYVLKESKWNYNSLESLDNQKICAIAGYSYGEPFDGWSVKHETDIQFVNGDEPALRIFKMLILKRTDIFIEDYNVANFIMNKHGIADKFRSAGVNGEPQPVYIGFSPAKTESGEYAEILSAGIIEIRKTGRLQQILDKYGLSDWKQ